MTTDEDRHAAVRNNAEWCDVVCRTHGVAGEFRAASWTSATRTPELYPDAITLSPTATTADVLPWIDTTAGCSVKASYGVVDLAPYGFEVLFDAQWIRRPAGREGPAPGAGVNWSTLRSAGALAAWQDAWSGGTGPRPFLPELLTVPAVRVVAGHRGDHVVAGAVLNRAVTVVGVSNIFAVDGDLGVAWAGVLASAAHHFPALTMVGYESGPALKGAVRTVSTRSARCASGSGPIETTGVGVRASSETGCTAWKVRPCQRDRALELGGPRGRCAE